MSDLEAWVATDEAVLSCSLRTSSATVSSSASRIYLPTRVPNSVPACCGCTVVWLRSHAILSCDDRICWLDSPEPGEMHFGVSSIKWLQWLHLGQLKSCKDLSTLWNCYSRPPDAVLAMTLICALRVLQRCRARQWSFISTCSRPVPIAWGRERPTFMQQRPGSRKSLALM